MKRGCFCRRWSAVIPHDARLANVEFLILAAKRRLATRQIPDWRVSVGISSLLAAAKALPRRDPWSMPALDTTSGMGKLLAEARAWQKEDRHGT
jgi:hypothetical protein